MVVAAISKVTNIMHSNEENSVVPQCAPHRCRDALNCSECKQVVQLVSSSATQTNVIIANQLI